MFSTCCFYLSDGRHVSFPTAWRKVLNDATKLAEPPPNFVISEDGQSVEWPDLKFRITLAELLTPEPWKHDS